MKKVTMLVPDTIIKTSKGRDRMIKENCPLTSELLEKALQMNRDYHEETYFDQGVEILSIEDV